MTIKEQVRATVKGFKQGTYTAGDIASLTELSTEQVKRAMKDLGYRLKNGFYFIRNKGRFVGI